MSVCRNTINELSHFVCTSNNVKCYTRLKLLLLRSTVHTAVFDDAQTRSQHLQ